MLLLLPLGTALRWLGLGLGLFGGVRRCARFFSLLGQSQSLEILNILTFFAAWRSTPREGTSGCVRCSSSLLPSESRNTAAG